MKFTDEIIIDYLDGMLNDSDKKLFEKELKTNVSLQKKIALFKEGEEMFFGFSEDYFKEDDIDYDTLKSTAYSVKNKLSKSSNNTFFHNIFKKTILNIPIPQLSGLLASIFFAYMLGSYAPFTLLNKSSKWTLAEQSYKTFDESFKDNELKNGKY